MTDSKKRRTRRSFSDEFKREAVVLTEVLRFPRNRWVLN